MKKNINALLRNRKIMSNIEVDSVNKKCKFTMATIRTKDRHKPDLSVRWQNFKGFKDTNEIIIKPITIIIGPNNCGKSSFLAPFLLMNQTITNNEGISPLIISDKVYDGGNVKELLNNFDLKKSFSFNFRYHIHEIDDVKNLKPVGAYPPGGVEVTFNVNNEVDRELCVEQETIYDYHNRMMVQLKKDGRGKYQLKGLPQNRMKQTEKKAINESKPLNFLFSPNSLLSAMEDLDNPLELLNKNKQPSRFFSYLLQVVTINFNLVRRLLGEISYIGPVREAPHRYYQLKNIVYPSVGARGENIPDIINSRKDIKIELNKWVKKFNFGDTVEFRKFKGSNSIGSIIFKNKNEKFYTNIANAGFGASQILPLIVQALVSEPGKLTIAEQPEIHLNPRLQVVLAELFCFMVKAKQKILVETHSEHLLLSIRNLVAKGEISIDDIAIYFVEKEDGESKIRPISIDANGKIPSDEWPKGFFGDTLKQSLELAAQQAKNRSKQK